MKTYFLLFTLLYHTLLLTAKEQYETLSYEGIDPAQVLFTLYINAHPGPTADDIVSALEVDLDALSLDDLRIELVNAMLTLPEHDARAPIQTLWGNALNVVFDLRDQNLLISKESPLNISELKKALCTLKETNEETFSTYEEVASSLYATWLAPFRYFQGAIQAWLNEETIPEYEALQGAYSILSHLRGRYASLESGRLFELALKTVKSDHLATLINLTQARALYSEGNRYKQMATNAASTNLKSSATEASKLAQAAAIHRILTGSKQDTLEEQLFLARRKVSRAKKELDRLYQQYLNQNNTRIFRFERSSF